MNDEECSAEVEATLLEIEKLAEQLQASHEVFTKKLGRCRELVGAPMNRDRAPSSLTVETDDDNDLGYSSALMVEKIADRITTNRKAMLEALTKAYELADVPHVEDAGVDAALRKVAALSMSGQRNPNGDVFATSAALYIGSHLVPIEGEGGLNVNTATDSTPFKTWVKSVENDKRINVSKIHIISVDTKGSEVVFLKFRVDADVNGTFVPGIVFQRDNKTVSETSW